VKVKIPLRICPKCGDYAIRYFDTPRFCSKCGAEYVNKDVEVEV